MESVVDYAINYILHITGMVYCVDFSMLVMVVLKHFGFSPDRDGFLYLSQAIELKSRNPELHLTTIYQMIVDLHGGNIECYQIDQAIRDAIKAACKMKKEIWLKCFPEYGIDQGKRPSNLKLISEFAFYITLAEKVWQKERGGAVDKKSIQT